MEVNREAPTRVVHSVDPNTLLMLPISVALREVPGLKLYESVSLHGWARSFRAPYPGSCDELRVQAPSRAVSENKTRFAPLGSQSPCAQGRPGPVAVIVIGLALYGRLPRKSLSSFRYR